MRVFLDTNILVSASATRGLYADVLRLILTEHDLLTGEGVLKELERISLLPVSPPPFEVSSLIWKGMSRLAASVEVRARRLRR